MKDFILRLAVEKKKISGRGKKKKNSTRQVPSIFEYIFEGHPIPFETKNEVSQSGLLDGQKKAPHSCRYLNSRL